MCIASSAGSVVRVRGAYNVPRGSPPSTAIIGQSQTAFHLATTPSTRGSRASKRLLACIFSVEVSLRKGAGASDPTNNSKAKPTSAWRLLPSGKTSAAPPLTYTSPFALARKGDP